MILKSDLWNALQQSPDTLFLRKELDQLLSPDRADDTYIKEQWMLLEQEARSYKETHLQTPMHEFFDYFADGSRKENAFFLKRKYLMVFALLLLKYPDCPDYRNNLEQVIWKLCNDLYWSLPAHFSGPGNIPLAIAGQQNLLDLFSCETGYALAEILYLHEDKLDKNLCDLAREQIQKRILDPYLDMHKVHRFELMTNNWSSVCCCSIGATAIYMEKDPQILTSLLMRVCDGLAVYLSSFGKDGICMEGVDYWIYGFGFFTCFADLLKQRTNGSCDLFSLPKVQQIAAAGPHYYLYKNHVASFSDSSPSSKFRAGLSSYLMSLYPDMKFPSMDYSASVLDDSCSRFCLSLRDLLWYNSRAGYVPSINESRYFPDSQWFISRSRYLQLAAKGGHNGESHNHIDAGSFLFFLRGENFLCDPGAGVYNKNYFSDKRYESFLANARSHNIPLINGNSQLAGIRYQVTSAAANLGQQVDLFCMDLTHCYEDDTLYTFERTLHVYKDSGKITLEDHFCFHLPGTITENFISPFPMEPCDGHILIKGREHTLTLTYDSGIFRAELSQESYQNQKSEPQTAYILQLTNHQPAKHVNAVIHME